MRGLRARRGISVSKQRLTQLRSVGPSISDATGAARMHSRPTGNPQVRRAAREKSVKLTRSRMVPQKMSGAGRVTRASPVQTAVRNCTRDEGRRFGFGNQVLIPSHRKLLRLNVVVVSVAEKLGR